MRLLNPEEIFIDDANKEIQPKTARNLLQTRNIIDFSKLTPIGKQRKPRPSKRGSIKDGEKLPKQNEPIYKPNPYVREVEKVLSTRLQSITATGNGELIRRRKTFQDKKTLCINVTTKCEDDVAKLLSVSSQSSIKAKLDTSSRPIKGVKRPVARKLSTVNSKKPKKAKENDLTDEEIKIYGDRMLPGYNKLSLLGKYYFADPPRGGQAVVWLVSRIEDGHKFAVKQIALQGRLTEASMNREIELDRAIFEGTDHPGQDHVIRIVDYSSTPKDVFIVLELGGECLSKNIYSFKGEFHKGERVYQITNYSFHWALRNNKALLGGFLKKLLLALDLTTSKGLIHCDLKTENILVNYDVEGQLLEGLKLIDFGASFMLNPSTYLSVTTPEYLPPEYLKLFSSKSPAPNNQKLKFLSEKSEICIAVS